ncbi:hypothetical protein BC937DRAFT_86819 [Endogone sp. FLAS-F59071]|nr:hypothetical protein BC937DRAFT_86819 [Endogone sp. FLAS-F59071]|eukprot:RUS19840.1 hypothetical protein BC937DRAFT_86819 [Endogone sp. FLAS-F59071]
MVHPSLFRRQNLFFFFSISLFFILILAFFYLVPSSNTPPHSHSHLHSMADENISVLSEKFSSLRALKGHYNGGEFNKDIDGPQGEKHQVMKALGDQLGLPNTPASEILQRLGNPDDLTLMPPGDYPPTVAMMPGPVLPTAEQGAMNPALQQQQSQPQPYYLVYYWRGKHDYLYFKIDPVKETVITSGWYGALE